MIRRQRAVFLIEMLPVLLALAVGGTLMTVGLTSILRSQMRVADFGNRYAVLNDFLRCISRDLRRAETASLHGGDGDDLLQTLVIGEMPEQVSYRFYKRHVDREGFRGDAVAAKRWDPMTATIKMMGERAVPCGALVGVSVLWHRADADDPEPNRRFDLAIRCAGERGDDGN